MISTHTANSAIEHSIPVERSLLYYRPPTTVQQLQRGTPLIEFQPATPSLSTPSITMRHVLQSAVVTHVKVRYACLGEALNPCASLPWGLFMRLTTPATHLATLNFKPRAVISKSTRGETTCPSRPGNEGNTKPAGGEISSQQQRRAVNRFESTAARRRRRRTTTGSSIS